VIREDFADGTQTEFGYDAYGRVTSATDSTGTTTFTYDGADRLTHVVYPTGRWLSYEYDAAGRRTLMTDQDGFVVKNAYDAAGRLSTLRDASDALIITYTYDAAGRLSREDKGNGTYTVYTYDGAGQTKSIVNSAPDGSVNSRFDYTYDALGRRTGMGTIDGDWTYSYDLTGQLSHAVFVSTNPDIPSQDLSYEYDAVGNRVRTIENGVTTDYVTNALNQYTSSGDTNYRYDLDGNLIEETGLFGTNQYAYDPENRLVQVVTSSGTWKYEYDVFGNRSAATLNHRRTQFVSDPTNLFTVVGEYDDGEGQLVNYTYGIGLVSKVDPGGAYYYDFDALGSTAGLSGSSGLYINAYQYEPEGRTIVTASAVTNPFQFIGRKGVATEGSSITIMGFRGYLSRIGRFISRDPIGITSADALLYGYVSNSLPNDTDSLGLYTNNTFTDELRSRVPLIPVVPTHPDDSNVNKLGGVLQRSIPKPNLQYSNDVNGLVLDTLLGPMVVRKSECMGKDRWDYGFPSNDYSWFNWFSKPQIRFVPGGCEPQIGPDPDKTPKPDGTTGPSVKPPIPLVWDPNEKLGASGYGQQAYIIAAETIPYRVKFENLGPGTVPTPAHPATAPAQRVEVTDQLSTNLDWSSFQFTEAGFGDTMLSVPQGRTYYYTQTPMTYNGSTFMVEVELGFDSATGQVRAVFQTIDPSTSLPPDVLTGFLPPEDGTGIGQGYFAYTVQPRAGLPSGTEIRNVALISFDFQTIIATNQVDPQDPSQGTDPTKEALNTIDAGTPTSAMTALPASTPSADIPLTWTGSDEAGGAGIGSFDIYVSADGGPFVPYLLGTTDTSAVYPGSHGHTYAFYSVARDNVGHVEAPPTTPDAVTFVSPAGIAVSPTEGLVTSEAGQTASFTVVLTAQPRADVSIALSSSDTTEGDIWPQTLTFSPGNWDVPQTVTVIGLDDHVVDGPVNYTIILAPAVSADTDFAGIDPADVSVTNLDHDVPGKAETTTVVTTASITPSYGDSLVFTAVVSPIDQGEPSPTGSVQFQIDGAAWGAPVLIETATGQASSQPIATLDAGPHLVMAVYSGDESLEASTSDTLGLDVQAALLTVTANDQTRVYGESNPDFSARYDGFVLGQDPTVLGGTLTFTTPANQTSHVGEYPVTPMGLTSSNYAITFVPGTLAISPAALTITAEDASKVYGAELPVFNASYTGFVNGDTPASLTTPVVLSTSATVTSHVGTYAIIASGASSADYSISYVKGTLSVTPAALTVTADAQAKTYGEANPALTYQITSGWLVNGDSFSGALSRDAGENVGGYAIGQGALALSADYALTYVGADLTISPREVTVAADAKTKLYGEADPTLTYCITLGVLVSGDSFSGRLSRDAGEEVGSYTINQGALALSANYALGFTGANLTITARPITVTADPKTKARGEADAPLTYQVTSGELVAADAFIGSLTRLPGENVGVYPIQQGTLTAGPNYDLAFVGANFTITAPGQVGTTTVVTISNSGPTYGESWFVTAAVGPDSGTDTPPGTVQFLVDGNTFGAPVTLVNGVAVSDPISALAAGVHTISANYSPDGLFAASAGETSTTIARAPLTVTADGRTKVYGEMDPLLTYHISSGSPVNGDSFSGGSTRVPGEDAGGYAIQQGTLTAGPNYEVAFVGDNLTITARPLTVTPDSQIKTYGDTLTAFTGTVDGIKNGDPITASYRSAGAVPEAGVGAYVITAVLADPAGKLSNYNVTLNTGTLTVNKAPLTITADDATRLYGDPNPPFAGTISGIKNGDDITASYSTSATQDSPVGRYEIKPAAVDLTPSTLGNYDVYLVSGVLEVTPREASRSISGLVYDDFNGDGLVDFGEKGIPGTTVTLIGTDDLGRDITSSQTTDSDGAYIFLNLRPGQYKITEAQPAGYDQGINSLGTAGGTVSGDEFALSLASDISAMNYNFGEHLTATGAIRHGQTATIAFWNNWKGQTLIKSLNGVESSTQLGNWLAATFPNMYGSDAGSRNLTGKTNAEIASFFQSLYVLKGIKVDAQVMATALSVYVTNPNLDSTRSAERYGFTVRGDGTGTSGLFNVGSYGEVFGVANNSTLTVIELLHAVNARTVNGVIANGSLAKRLVIELVFSLVNQVGSI